MGSTTGIGLKKGDTIKEVNINLPASKSISNRLLIIRSLSGSAIDINNLSTAKDTAVLFEILQNSVKDMNVGPAGTAMRFLTAYAAVTPGVYTIEGSDRMNSRPIGPLVDALRSLGAEIEYLKKEGFAPLKITGGSLEGGKLEVDGTLSSQFISALLMIGPYVKRGILLKLTGGLTSYPYIKMTCDLMHKCGAGVFFINKGFIEVQPVEYKPATITVEADWTAASYFYSWVALNNDVEIKITGLHVDSLQGDSKLMDIYEEFAVTSSFENGVLTLKKGNKTIKNLSFDLSDCPDLAQTIACTAAGLKVKLKLTGLKTLRYKETDRIAALQNELKKLGVETKSGESELELVSFAGAIDGVPGIQTYQDHRMAMSFAPLVAIFPEMQIENHEVVNKSFPDFWKEFEKLGVFIVKE